MNTQVVAPVIRDSFDSLPDALLASGIPLHRAMLVFDNVTASLFSEELTERLRGVFSEVHAFVLPSGEQNKVLERVADLLVVLMERRFDRSDLILAVGGGVVGDMAGFAAAVYLRGIRVVQIPTTLLAQIDSSIGGKTGVDLRGYKNMIGAFHLPAMIYTNAGALASLPEDQYRSGLAEVIKTGLLGDEALYRTLKEERERILSREREVLTDIIGRTASVKVRLVREDPAEKGIRALLNLGHTVGHAVEKAADFTLPHGFCVSIGTAAAARLSCMRGMIPEETCSGIVDLLLAYGLPVRAPGMDPTELLALTKSDKKMAAGQIRFILIERPGHAVAADDVTDEELLEAIRSIT